ncbi:hypothetical protein F5051DRAFT_110675 [Lentinula edodes]|nr:hypothetical protein F5051DRAFT_110675 [Lentinula edodes]
MCLCKSSSLRTVYSLHYAIIIFFLMLSLDNNLLHLIELMICTCVTGLLGLVFSSS